jgi:hypothetical protein
MPKLAEPAIRTVTALDLQLASVYFPILIDLAKDKRTISYGELIDRARVIHPNRKIVQNAIPVGTGRRLDVVRDFCTEWGLPDLSSLVVNGATKEVGTAFSQVFDPIEVRREVFSFDWSAVSVDFSGFLRKAESALAPRAKLTRDGAIQIMWEHYKANKATIPKWINGSREQIIDDILAGIQVEDAFATALSAPPPPASAVKSAKR